MNQFSSALAQTTATLVAAALLGLSSASASAPAPAAAGPCGTLLIFLNVYDAEPVGADYRTDAVFPNAAKDVHTAKPFSFTCPQYTAAYDGNTLKLSGKTLDDALSHILGYNKNGSTFELVDPNYDVDKEREYQKYAIGLRIELECITPLQAQSLLCQDLHQSLPLGAAPPALQPQITGLDLAGDVAIAVRQDGDPLQPAWYDGKPLKYVLDRLRPYEIYIQPHPVVVFEKIRIDPLKYEIVWTKKSAFPKR